MGFFDFFSGGISNVVTSESGVPEIYPFSLVPLAFQKADIVNTYKKILTDTLERTHPLSDKVQLVLWDNCVQSNSNLGLVTLLSCAMFDMTDLFLVYDSALSVLRKATQDEEKKIRDDYAKSAESKTGVFISFKNYTRTEMLVIYSLLEYCVMSALHKSLNLSNAVQVKISDLRASVALTDSEVARAQARSIAESLKRGLDVMMDVKDEIVTATVDTAPTEKAVAFLDAKKAFILGMPMSYVSGEQTSGIGSTGEADMRAIERGLKQYFVSIIHPVLKALFNVDTEFKSQDFRQVSSAVEVLKVFDLVSDENLSQDSKREILARMFDLDPKKEVKLIEKGLKENPPQQVVPPSPVSGQVKVVNPKAIA